MKIIAQLHKNLYYYETLHVDDFTHRVVKRGIKHSSNPFNTIKEVEFKALGRNFRLILHPHKEVLHHNFKAYVVNSTGEEQIIHFGELVMVFPAKIFIFLQRLHIFHMKFHILNQNLLKQTTVISTADEYLENWTLM